MSAYNSGILQGKAYRVLQHHLSEVLDLYALSIPEWKILGLLFDHTTLKTSDLSTMLDVEPPLVTRLIGYLEKRELIGKKQDKQDQRSTNITITAKGKKLIPQVEQSVQISLGQLLQGVTPEQLQTYKYVLETIVKNGKSKKVKKEYLII